MANEVYANGMEVACKAAAGKSAAAFPDTCLSPPSPPAGPVPVPYPNTAYASDTTDGSTTVMISNQEIMLKDRSTFKKSTGNEAATKSLGMGVVTHAIQGEASFAAWSMDVKIEGENACRHLDITLHNEQCYPANTATWPYIDASAIAMGGACYDEAKNEKTACENCHPYGDQDPCEKDDCHKARKCMLAPYNPDAALNEVHSCCPGTTGHHVIPVQEFCKPGKPRGRITDVLADKKCKYNLNRAPCICVEGEDHKEDEGTIPFQLKEHGLVGSAYIQARLERGISNKQADVKYSDLSDCGAQSVSDIHAGCQGKCIKAQLDNYHVKTAHVPEEEPILIASQQSDYNKD